MTYVKTSVPKPGINKGLGGNKNYNITFFDFDDVATFPDRDASGVAIAGNIVMNTGANVITVYGTVDTIKANYEASGDLDAEGVIQSVIFNHPGNELAIREFMANWLSRNIGIIVQHVTDTDKDLYGSPAAPLRMVFKHDEDKDKNVTEFTLKTANKGTVVAKYNGTIPTITPAVTVAADATSITLSVEGRYQLTTPTASAKVITAATGATNGMVFTLVGVAGTYNSTIPKTSTSFLLAGGVTWTGSAGAEITFKAMLTDTATYNYIELSRK
jgi:hypothetical protein